MMRIIQLSSHFCSFHSEPVEDFLWMVRRETLASSILNLEGSFCGVDCYQLHLGLGVPSSSVTLSRCQAEGSVGFIADPSLRTFLI